MSDNPEKCANYLRIIRLIVDVGTKTVRDLFYFYKPKEKVASFFASYTIHEELSDLKKRRVITAEQFEKLIHDPNPEEFDISLLITILVNLFKWTVDPPKNGWDQPIRDGDTSLGACLLRLKKLRNSLVGHSADAKLSLEEFETLWDQAECILRQIACFTKNDKIEEVLQSYRSSPLDCDGEDEDKYISLLRQWYGEGVSALASLQKEVEDLCKTTNEFGLFFKSSIPDRYMRYVLLLFEGGLLVLADILKRELRKDGTDLESVLACNKYSIQLQCIAGSPHSIYKDGTIETDVSKWGLKQLAEVILHVYRQRLSKMECRAISSIGKAYEDFAKIAMASLDSDKFRPYWTDIVSNINFLSAGLDDDSQMACQDLIKGHDTGPIDETTAKIYLLQLRQDCSPLNTLVHQYLDAREKLKHAVEQMQREGACFGHDQVIELKMMTNGKTEEKRKLAEDILQTVWEKAVSLSDDPGHFEAIKEAVDKILEGIKVLPGVKVTSVERHCIILALRCSSCTGLLELLDFLVSTPFTDCIQSFSQTLSEYCEEKIIVTAFITIDSIIKTMETLSVYDKDRFQSSVGIKVNCSSVDAIRSLQQVVRSSETTNNVNNIAQALSENLREKLSIKTVLDMGSFDDMHDKKSFAPLVSSAWTQFILPAYKHYFGRRVPVCSRTSHLRFILAEIKGTEKTVRKALHDKHRSALKTLQDLSNSDNVSTERQMNDLSRSFEKHQKEPYSQLSVHGFNVIESSVENANETPFLSSITKRKRRKLPNLKFVGLDPYKHNLHSSPEDRCVSMASKSTKVPTWKEKTKLTRSSSLPLLSKQYQFPHISVLEKRTICSKSLEMLGTSRQDEHFAEYSFPPSEYSFGSFSSFSWSSINSSSEDSLELNVQFKRNTSWEELSPNTNIVEKLQQRRRRSSESRRDSSNSESPTTGIYPIFRHSLKIESPTTELDYQFSANRDLGSCSSFGSFSSIASSKQSNLSNKSIY